MSTPEPPADHELWPIARVAEHLGYTGPSADGSARKTLSRLGVKAVQHRPGDGRRVHALYSSQHVKAAAAARPGQGARTAPGTKESPAEVITARALLASALTGDEVVISGPEGDFEYPASLVIALAGKLAGTATLREICLDYPLEVESADQTAITFRAGFANRYEVGVDGKATALCAQTDCWSVLPNPDQQGWCTAHVNPNFLDRHLTSIAAWIAERRMELQQLENRTQADAAARD